MNLATPILTSLGATCTPSGVTYRVWAPERRSARVLYGSDPLVGRSIALQRDEDGYFVGQDPEAKAGDLYRFFLDEQVVAPDPASRYQPFGIFGPSMIVDPQRYTWNCRSWLRPPMRGRVI